MLRLTVATPLACLLPARTTVPGETAAGATHGTGTGTVRVAG